MIKSIILDIDGVFIGNKEGFNFPHPHQKIIQKLNNLQSEGINISLITARGNFSIVKMVKDMGLDTFHTTDGGGLVWNPILEKIGHAHYIDKNIAQNIVKEMIASHIYTELYPVGEYYKLTKHSQQVATMRKKILGKLPHEVENLEEIARELGLIRILPIAQNEKDVEHIEKILSKYKENIELNWTKHPATPELLYAIVTATGVSKGGAIKEVSQLTGIPLGHTLGVGDTIHDWQFIEQCGYASTLENGTEEIKEKVKSKEDKGYISPKGVNENGLLDILDYFL